MPTMLSKSRVLAARQCPKRLWLEVNRPGLRVVSPDTQRRFDQGHRLNDVVHRLIPDGRLIAPEVTLGTALGITKRHLARSPDAPLFEATFSRHRVLVRADVFERTGDAWRLTEVKSSTRVKPYHLDDCAVQAWVIGEAGYPVAETVLAHIDTDFVYRGDGNYRGLLKHQDVTEQIEARLPQVPGWVAEGLEALAGDEPAIAMGDQCTDPFECPFLEHCSPEPVAYPVTRLPNRGRIVDQLLAEGIEDIRDIPPGRLTRPLHERVRLATVSGEPYIAEELAAILQGLPYPRHYLDFESIQFVVPVWPDTRPYEQLPFQWSCQIEENDGRLSEVPFLDLSGEPPMRGCAEKLLATLGAAGPVLTYSPFERQVIHGLARRFPDLRPALEAAAARILDLLPLIRQHYYHPAMRGSFSIKAVLPTVAPHLSYADLGDVKDGTAAQVAFEEAIAADTPRARRDELRNALLKYCALDTLAMVETVRFLSTPKPFSSAQHIQP